MRQCLGASLSCLQSSELDLSVKCSSLVALQKTLTDSILPRPPLSGSLGSFTATEGCLCATGFISSFLKRLHISLSTFYSQITYPPSFTILGRFGIILDPAAPACVCSFWTQTSQLIFYDNVQLKKKKKSHIPFISNTTFPHVSVFILTVHFYAIWYIFLPNLFTTRCFSEPDIKMTYKCPPTPSPIS